MRGHSGVCTEASASTEGPPSPSGGGLTRTGGAVGVNREQMKGWRSMDAGTMGGGWMEGCSHSFSNSHSFEEFAVEIGTLP